MGQRDQQIARLLEEGGGWLQRFAGIFRKEEKEPYSHLIRVPASEVRTEGFLQFLEALHREPGTNQKQAAREVTRELIARGELRPGPFETPERLLSRHVETLTRTFRRWRDDGKLAF